MDDLALDSAFVDGAGVATEAQSSLTLPMAAMATLTLLKLSTTERLGLRRLAFGLGSERPP